MLRNIACRFGIEAITSANDQSCFPRDEKLDGIPKDENDNEILYFVKNGKAFLIIQSKKFVVHTQ